MVWPTHRVEATAGHVVGGEARDGGGRPGHAGHAGHSEHFRFYCKWPGRSGGILQKNRKHRAATLTTPPPEGSNGGGRISSIV